jgi:hypothetical protein
LADFGGSFRATSLRMGEITKIPEACPVPRAKNADHRTRARILGKPDAILPTGQRNCTPLLTYH